MKPSLLGQTGSFFRPVSLHDLRPPYKNFPGFSKRNFLPCCLIDKFTLCIRGWYTKARFLAGHETGYFRETGEVEMT